jgi:hypothetical protein
MFSLWVVEVEAERIRLKVPLHRDPRVVAVVVTFGI